MVKVNVSFSNQNFYILICFFLLMLATLTPVYRTVVDIGDGITHQNHEDTITTPLPGNCPNCDYPDCGGCDGQPQITLEPTEIISTIPPFPNPATPDIPDATQFPTTFPTFEINGILPTPLPTMGVSTVVPTIVAPTFPPPPVL